MLINLDTGDMSVADAHALIALIRNRFPDALRRMEDVEVRVTMNTGSIDQLVAERTAGDAAAAFSEGGPATVLPVAEEAFAPQATGTAIAPSAENEPATSAYVAPVSTASPPETSGVTAVPVDSAGVPWDERIHSGGQAKIGDGTWKKKRGVGNDVVATVTQELLARMASTGTPTPAATAPAVATAPAPPAANVAPSAPVPPAPAPVTTTTQQPVSTAGPPAAAPASAPLPPAAIEHAQAAALAEFDTGPPPAVRFGGLMKKASDAQTAGTIDPAGIASVNAAVGIASAAELLRKPELMDAWEATLDALVGG